MFITPPIGLMRAKAPPPIQFISSNWVVNAPANSPFISLSNILAGDIIVASAGKSGSGSGSPATVTGYTSIFSQSWTNIVQNSFMTAYKVAVGGETGITFNFPATGGWAIGAVFRNASAMANVQSQQNGIQTTIFPLGQHTESDTTSMAVLVGWLNVNATNNPGSITEPSGGYTLTTRADGATAGGSFQDRILSMWHRTYDNRGVQNPQYSKSNFDSSDNAFSNMVLSI